MFVFTCHVCYLYNISTVINKCLHKIVPLIFTQLIHAIDISLWAHTFIAVVQIVYVSAKIHYNSGIRSDPETPLF